MQKKNIKLMYNSFSLNNINDHIILFHYLKMKKFPSELLKNSDFVINSFISTTMIKKSAGIKKLIITNHFNSMLVIYTKKGTPCIPIGNNPNGYLKEYEIILKPKSKFKVVSVKRKIFARVKYIIECELM